MTYSSDNPDPLAKVVLVNDDSTQLNMLCGLLQKVKLIPMPFRSAEAALAAMGQDAAPVLIITDLYMPGIDGWRFCRLLRSPGYAQFNLVPILVMSATYSGIEPAQITSDLGANAFLPMPVDGKLFLEQVQSLLKGEEPRKAFRVLLVEKSQRLSSRFQRAMLAHGYQVDTASSHPAGLIKIDHASYDLVVLDGHLPGNWEKEILPVLQEKHPDCVCILMTTDPQPELILKWMKMGVADYVQKPCAPKTLIDCCERARKARALLRIQDLLEIRTRQLRESEEKYRHLVHYSSDPIFAFNPDETYRFVNEAFARPFGKKPEEIIGKTPHSIFPFTEAEKRLTLVRQVFSTGIKGEIEVKVISNSGEIRFYITLADPILDNGGKVLYVTCIAKDITERKRVEESLRLSEDKFSTAFRISPDSMNINRLEDGMNVEINEGFTALTGYTAEDVLGKTSRELNLWVIPQDRDQLVAGLRKYGEVKNLETQFRTQNGQILICLISARVIELNHEKCVLTITRDITDRKQAENALYRSERRYRNLIEWTPEPIAVHRNGILLYVNQSATKMMGANSAQDLIGKPILDLVHSDYRQAILAQVKNITRAESYQPRFELKFLKLDGTVIDVELQGTSIEFDGEPAIHVAMRDITERKQAENTLRASEASLKFSQRVAHVGHWTWDTISNHVTWSDEMYRIFGLDPANFGGDLAKVIAQSIHPDDREKVNNSNSTVLTAQKPAPMEYRVIWPDQSVHTVWAEPGDKIYNANGKIIQLNGIVQDISERVRAEEEIRKLNAELEQRVQQRTAELQAANKELEAFSYSVSHDLRAPLRALDGFSGALLSDYPDQLDQQAKHYLVRIQAASRRMRQIIDDLLNLSQINRCEMQLSRIDLSLMAHQIYAGLLSESPERQVKLDIHPGLSVRGDPGLIKIALENLLQNAFKFTARKTVAHIQFGMTGQNGESIYYVRDDGVGFNMDYAEKLFTPFQRLHGASEYPGTGIGLTIVQRIITRHGGRIWPESSPDQGTTFYFTLKSD
jgi:PAS domain S-box-containing protein